MNEELKNYQQALKAEFERYGLFPGAMGVPSDVVKAIQSQTRSRTRWEILNSGLVKCLILAIGAVQRKHKNRFHYTRDLEIGHVAAANFQKLRFHALIAHADEKNPKSGEWLITKRGGQFLRGEIAVPRKVAVCRNSVVDHGKDLIHIKQFRNLPPEFDPIYAYEEPVILDSGKQSLFT